MNSEIRSNLNCAVAKMEKIIGNYDIIPVDQLITYLKELACEITVDVNKSEIHPYYYSHLMDCISQLMNDDTLIVEKTKCIIYYVKHILKDTKDD